MTDFSEPPPGEELNPGAETIPRQAATVILLRGGSEALELLLVQRNPASRFMGGAWVFPGGAVDAEEGEGDAAHRRAALRELEEEAGIAVADPDALVKFSRWITPAEVKIRFDTHFFLAPVPEGAEARPDGAETVAAQWYSPREALDAHLQGDLLARVPHHQAPRAARRVRQLAGAHRVRARARGRAGPAARRGVGRDRPRPASGRARLRRIGGSILPP